jgi:hypothetical protein
MLTAEQLARYEHKRLCPVDSVYLMMDARLILPFTLTADVFQLPFSPFDAGLDLTQPSSTLPLHILADIHILRHHRLLQEI